MAKRLSSADKFCGRKKGRDGARPFFLKGREKDLYIRMRSERNKKQKNEVSKLNRFTRVWSVLYLLIAAAFFGMLAYTDILKLKYLCMAAGILILLLLLTVPALYSRKFKKSRTIISLILSIMLTAVCAAGMVYMGGTLDFFSKITKVGASTEKYYAVVRKDSGITDGEGLRGKTVHTYLSGDTRYAEAKNKLQDELDVEYAMDESLSALAAGLLDRTCEAVFVSEAHYTTITEEHSDFAPQTEIVYTVEIEIAAENIAKNVGVTQEPFNVYISGLDISGSIDTVSRSDVNMIVSVNPVTHQVLLTSLPRDAYIALPGKGGAMDKLTHTGLYGVSESIAAAEELLGIDINYYVKVNYTTVKDLVDAIGGIDVHSDFTFTTHGMGVYYAFYEGENHLDGSMALAFARERQSFSDGDLQRNRNQQLVMEAILKKATGSATILTKYTSILNAIENSVETNMSQDEIQELIKMQLDGMPSWDIQKQSIIGTAGSALCYSTGDYYVSVVDLDQESVVSAVEQIVRLTSAQQ